MKTLFIARSHIGLAKGGLEKQIELTANGLKNRGIEVIPFNPWENQVEQIDVCHFWSTSHQMSYHLEYAKKIGKPTVISPVFMRFEDSMFRLMLEYNLGRLIRGLFTGQRLFREMINKCDIIIALNKEEAFYLKKVLGVPDNRIRIVPNGIDRKFSGGNPQLFEQKYGIQDFVLQVGSIGPRKNALRTILAVSQLPYSLVLIGGPEAGQQEYYNKCKLAAGKNVLMLGHVENDDPLLASAYKAAKVFVLPSFSEVMPLAVYEAAQAGCNLVMSDTYPCEEIIREHVYFTNPKNVKQLTVQIHRAMQADRDTQLQQKALAMPTWQDISDQIMDIYKNLLK